jgi:hypothetical protein
VPARAYACPQSDHPLQCWSDAQRCRVPPRLAYPTRQRMGDKAKPPVETPDGFAANPQMTTRNLPPRWSLARCDAWPSSVEINPPANFLSNKNSEEQPRGIVLARLICTRCRADVKSVLRCRACGALCPTSQIGAAMLSPPAFTFYVFVLVVVAIFWFA